MKRRPADCKSAPLRTIVCLLVFLLLLGCGGGSQPAAPASSSAAATASSPVAHSVHLAWTPSASADVVGYNVYRGAQSGGPYERLNAALVASSDYLDTAVLAGRTYYYGVTAVSAAAESGLSAEVTAVIPTP